MGRKHSVPAIIAVASFFISGCIFGGGGGSDSSSPDSTPPTVSSTQPAADATEVSTNTSITATFSEAMTADSLTTTTFTLTSGASTVSGTVNYSGSTATFTPSENLTATTVYTATISTGAKDLAGNPLAADYIWLFTSGGAQDLTPPAVISTTPANNAVNLPLSTIISATFSEAMDPTTLTSTTFTVSDGGGPIIGTVGYSAATATFTPSAALTMGATYTATITTGAKDLAGNSLAADFTWQFGMLAKPDLCVTPGGVNSCYDKINDALAAASTGDIIGVAAGTYTESVVIDKTVTLEGGWDLAFTALDPASNVTTIQPSDPTFAVVWVNGNISDTSDVAPTIDGFTITGAVSLNHGGGLRIQDSDAIVRNNLITGNQGYLYGGGVWVQSGAPTLENNRIENNALDTNGGEGGGIKLEGTQATLIGNTIDSNTIPTSTGSGGGIAIGGGGPVTLTNNTITNNAAATLTGAATDYAYGGGVWVSGATVVMTGNLIQSNTANSAATAARGFGGGVYISDSTSFALTGNTVDQNTAGYLAGTALYLLGGGILINSSQGRLSGNVISNNQANRYATFGSGGGVASTSSTLTVEGGQIISNKVSQNCEGYGGGLYAKDSAVTLDGALVQSNCAANTPFYGMGGGLAFLDSPFTLTNAVIADNYSFGNNTSVGGIFSGLSATILTNNSPGVLVNNTVANNNGQGINVAAATTLVNNIIVGKVYSTGVNLSGAGPVTAKNNGFYNNATNNGGFAMDSSNIVINPQLASDYHLMAGSPMIDAGTHGPVLKAGSATETVDIPAADMDGESRAMIGSSGLYKVDIGADENTGAAQRIVDLDAGGADLTVIGPGGISGSATNAPTNDWIGYSVLADDINGDGKSDLVTGAEDFAIDPDNDPFTPGRLFGIFNSSTRKTGTIDLLDTDPDLTIDNQMTLQHIGSALAGGDLNGDGKHDLIAGSYQDDGAGGGNVWPTVFVFWGGSSLAGSRLLDGAHPADFALQAPGQDFFAFSEKNALTTGDLNNDGKSDLIVGDGLADNGGTADAGAVFVIFGSSGLTGLHDLGATAADYTLYGPSAAAGLQSAAVGKVDGGSQVDLVARTATTAYVIFGPISGTPPITATTATANITITGLAAGGAAVMDLTGDGQDDLILGSADKVYILPGPLAAGTYAVGTVSGLITLTGAADAVAKDEVFAAGNVVGDSNLDLIIGSPTLKKVFVIAGGTSLSGTVAAADASAMLVKSATLDHLGFDVAAGDMDNDGRPDLILSTKQQTVTGHDISEPKFDDAGIVYVIYGQ